MAVVYKHTRMDNGLPFYIGIGKTIARAKSKKNRNKYWHNIVNKCGYNIEILHTNVSWEQSCELEKQYIKQYGRSDLGLGPLVNMTDGGEGTINLSDETREKMSKAQKGKKHSIETNSKKGSVGDKNPSKRLEVRKKISLSKMGKKINEITKNKISLKLCGENSTNVKLKNDDVIWIRENYIMNHSEFGTTPLSKKFNVCKRNILAIINRKRWKHI